MLGVLFKYYVLLEVWFILEFLFVVIYNEEY